MSLFWTCRAFLPGMIAASRGHVVTVASAAGMLGVAGLVDYCTSKWAAVGFDEALRMELRRIAPRLRTTVVCPYLIDTGLAQGVRPRFPRLTPPLKPDVVAARIVRAIARDERLLVMPPLMRLLPVLNAVPAGLKNWLMDMFGVHHCMDTFAGHPPRQIGCPASITKPAKPLSTHPKDNHGVGMAIPSATQDTEQYEARPIDLNT